MHVKDNSKQSIDFFDTATQSQIHTARELIVNAMVLVVCLHSNLYVFRVLNYILDFHRFSKQN